MVNTAVFTLKAHEDVTDTFDFVIDQWRKDIGPGTQVVLGKCPSICVFSDVMLKGILHPMK